MSRYLNSTAMENDDDGESSSNRPFFFPREAEAAAVEEHHNILSWAFSSPTPASLDPFGLSYPLPVRPPVPPPPPPPSAFTDYRAYAIENFGSGGPNANLRMIRFLNILSAGAKPASSDEGAAPASGRVFRHMMRERLRRETLSQGYADLHSILSSRSRGDKISIVRSAQEYLKELQEEKDGLCRRNRELQHLAAAHARNAIRVQAESRSSSSLDSAIAALRSVKRMELEASAVRTSLAGGSLSMEVVFATEVARDEVERELKAALAAAGPSQF